MEIQDFDSVVIEGVGSINATADVIQLETSDSAKITYSDVIDTYIDNDKILETNDVSLASVIDRLTVLRTISVESSLKTAAFIATNKHGIAEIIYIYMNMFVFNNDGILQISCLYLVYLRCFFFFRKR